MVNTRSMVDQGVGIVVALTVGLILVAFLLPVAIEELVTVDTASWSSGAGSLFEILDLIAILVVFLVFIGWAMTSYGRGGGN